MPKRQGRGSKAIISVLLPVLGSILVGSIIILAAGSNPIATYINIFETGFTCQWNSSRCALIATVQFATPLILTGLSAAVALWANFITLGQAGQMLLGAASATWVASNINLPAPYLPIVALAAGVLAGAIWGFFPALLREFLGMNEIITTLLLTRSRYSSLALYGFGSFQRRHDCYRSSRGQK